MTKTVEDFVLLNFCLFCFTIKGLSIFNIVSILRII